MYFKKQPYSYLTVLLIAFLITGLLLTGCGGGIELLDDSDRASITEDGQYTTPEEVAEYLHVYGYLPDNFITKDEAKALGWDSQKGNLDEVAPGMSIGGDRFGNREGTLPKGEQRKYYECDVNYEGGYRGGERLVYSDDGLIYYTADHYTTFEQIY